MYRVAVSGDWQHMLESFTGSLALQSKPVTEHGQIEYFTPLCPIRCIPWVFSSHIQVGLLIYAITTLGVDVWYMYMERTHTRIYMAAFLLFNCTGNYAHKVYT